MGSQPKPNMQLLPWPHSIDLGNGSSQLESSLLQADFVAMHSSRLQSAVIKLGEELAQRTGLAANPESAHTVHINCAELSPKYPGIEADESYWLVVDDAGVYLDAATELGALRGLTTLGQLVDEQGRIPHLAIDDRPRFTWRGLMLDPARHFLPVEAICRTLDGMSLCKLNVLHLHLSDDQGFRLPVDAFPALMSDPGYSADDLERIVEHAAGYGIRVVPEIDMPGHVNSWLVGYPEWGTRQVSPSSRFGVHEACLDPTSERVYEAIHEILGVLARSFPDPCVHIGGDEVSPVWWSADSKVKALMEREGLHDIRDVQAYFNRRVGELVKKGVSSSSPGMRSNIEICPRSG
jgi:hexosaminidase